jgi:hypothetical protein
MASNGQPTVYPLRADYVDALQNPAITLADPVLRRGTVACDKHGFPRPISGAFASVFQVTLVDGHRYAVKCFCQFVPDQERRYREISAALRMLHHPALVEFEYQQQGILVADSWYPVLKMEWVEAQSLLSWVEMNRFNGRRLHAVADQLVTIVADLEKAGIAHGDLQHGNLLIESGDRLRLIDYDGMYVPALDGLPANEKGLANYQPSTRGNHHFRPGLDRFSAWVIYVSLISLASAPHLWQMRAEGDEKLLFEAADYINPERSQALIALRKTGHGHLIHLADLIAELARTPVEEMPEFDPAGLLNRLIASGGVPSERTATDLPLWMDNAGVTAGAPSSLSLPESASSADGSWLSEYLPTAEPKGFAGSRISIIRTVNILVIVLGAGSALTEILTASSSVFGAATVLLSFVVSFIVLWFAYKRHPYYIEARQKRLALTAAQQEFHSAEDKHRTLADQRARVDADLRDRCKKIGEARTRSSVERQRATAATQATLNSALGTLTKKLTAVNASETSRRAARLQQIQETHIAQKLSQVEISKNPPSGIGDQLAKRLTQKGIRTAADFTGFYITGSSSARGETTWLELSNRQKVHVDGIGPKKAQALDDWRKNLIAYARQSAPTRLDDLAEKQLQAELFTERQHLNQQAVDAKAKAQRDQTAAIDRERAARYDLDRQEKAANDNAASQRTDLDRQLGTAQHEVTAKHVALRNAQRQCALYDRITFALYVKHVASLKS